jgi:hypothetical protein
MAAGAFWLVKERNGVVKFDGTPILENIASLGITVVGAVGIVLALVGVANL